VREVAIASGSEPTGLELDFLGWDRPLLESAARRLLDWAGAKEAARTGPVDLSRTLVVLPGARAGRRLKQIIFTHAESEGRTLRPPDAVTIGGLPERLYRSKLPRPDSVLDLQVWARALELSPEHEVARLAPSRDGVGDLGLVRVLRDLHHEVGAAGLDFGDVAEVCRSGLVFNDEERWSVLDTVLARYRALLADIGFGDVSAARAAALGAGGVSSEKDLWIVGCPDLPPIARSFVAALAERSRVRILVGAPEELADRFDAFGCVIPEAWANAHVDLPEADIEVVSSPAGQADAVARRLRELDGRFPAEEITVGVPDPEVVPYLVERLEEGAVHVRDARGRAIRTTSPFRLLDALARYLERPDFEGLADLVRHPTFEERLRSSVRSGRAPLGSPPDLPALLDRYQTAHLQAALQPRGLPSGGERTSAPLAPTLLGVLGGLERLLAPLELRDLRADSRRPLAEWAPRLAELFDEVFRGQLGEGGDASWDDVSVLERIAESLARLLSLPSTVDPPVPAHRAIRILLEDIRDEPLPEESGGSAVELLGWLELALDDASVMIVTGFNDPFVPSSVTSHPFLPHSLREKIGLLENSGRWARDLLALETMRRTRQRLCLVTGRRSAAGDPLMPSRLLFAADAEVVARRVGRLLSVAGFGEGESVQDSAEATRLGGDPAGDYTFAEGDARGSPRVALPPEPVISAPELPDRVRVTAFRELLTDPYAYALCRVLGLEPVRDDAREMDPLSFGTVAHAVLKRFGRSEFVSSVDAREVGAALEAFLDEEARSRFGARSLPAVRPQLGQLRSRLIAFASWQARWVGKGWRVRAVEASPPSGGVLFEVDGSPILLSGTIDRVDENVATGEWCVLDYKTGDLRKDPEETHRAGPRNSRRWVDLQLPLYRVLAASLERPEGGGFLLPRAALASLRLGYVQIPNVPSRTGEAWGYWTEAELAEAEEEARRAVRALRANRFEFDPARSSIRSDDPLAVVVGEGVLQLGTVAPGTLAAGSVAG
jgi:hypothetical protein